MSYKGAETQMINLWVAARLAAHTDFNTISTGLTDRIFLDLAPDGTPYPFIVFQQQSAPEVVRGVGPEEVMVDTVYVVKAIAQGTSFEHLAPVAAGIRAALHEPTGETVTDGVILMSRFERGFSMKEDESTKQFRHLGGEYRIQAQAS